MWRFITKRAEIYDRQEQTGDSPRPLYICCVRRVHPPETGVVGRGGALNATLSRFSAPQVRVSRTTLEANPPEKSRSSSHVGACPRWRESPVKESVSVRSE